MGNAIADYFIMLIILFLLGIELFYNVKFKPKNKNFFDLKNTKAIRGVGIFLIIFVHAPIIYQNKIQDMIGSFTYVFITFFFMTSAYGLTIAQSKNPDGIEHFWRKRLPKLLITSWIVNLIKTLLDITIYKRNLNIISLFSIEEWLKWLLACYFALWISFIVFKGKDIWKIACSVLVIIGSIIMYYLKNAGIYTDTTWHTECYGFIWGIILASIGSSECLNFFLKKWKMKLSFSILIAIVLGVLYLKFKPILFWGDYLLKILLGAAIIFLILVINAKVDFGNRISLFIGEMTLEIFLVHGYIIDLLNYIHVWKFGGMYLLSTIFITVISAIIIHVLTNLIMERVHRFL